jgi:hypothetical protein
MVVETNLWLCEPKYGMHNKNEVMNKYVGAKIKLQSKRQVSTP